MMKQITKTLAIALAAIALVACTGNKKQSNATVTTVKDSIAWQGTYEGIFPAADGPGIYVLLALNDNGEYMMYEKYLERTSSFVSKGTFEWSAAQDSVKLHADGNMNFKVEKGLISSVNDIKLSQINSDQKLSDSYTKQLIKENASGENVEVEIYTENDANIAQFSFGGKNHKLKENRENSQLQEFTDGTATLGWNIIDPAPLPDYKPTLTVDGKKHTFTRLSPTNLMYVADDAAAPVKAFDVLYFNIEEGKSFAALLSADTYYTLPQAEASAKTAVYEKDGVQWLAGNKKDARLVINGTEYRYKEMQFVK